MADKTDGVDRMKMSSSEMQSFSDYLESLIQKGTEMHYTPDVFLNAKVEEQINLKYGVNYSAYSANHAPKNLRDGKGIMVNLGNSIRVSTRDPLYKIYDGHLPVIKKFGGDDGQSFGTSQPYTFTVVGKYKDFTGDMYVFLNQLHTKK